MQMGFFTEENICILTKPPICFLLSIEVAFKELLHNCQLIGMLMKAMAKNVHSLECQKSKGRDMFTCRTLWGLLNWISQCSQGIWWAHGLCLVTFMGCLNRLDHVTIYFQDIATIKVFRKVHWVANREHLNSRPRQHMHTSHSSEAWLCLTWVGNKT